MTGSRTSSGTNVPELKRSIGFRDLVLFNVSAVLSLRWIATRLRHLFRRQPAV